MKKANAPQKRAATPAIKLPKLKDKSESRSTTAPKYIVKEKRVGFAFVGLGTLTLNELLPAVAESKMVKIAALVSGNRKKAETVALQYGVPKTGIYNYENFDEIRNNPEVDVIYIVLPNSMHEEFTIRSAKAGKHVLCEKPMATSVSGAKRMIAACKRARVKLMIAYRMQYEPFMTMIKEKISKKEYGKIRLVESINAQNTGRNHWRLVKALAGGGSLPDMGIYNLNTTRFILGEEPDMVLATIFSTPGDSRFKEVEETVMFQMFFPGGTISNNTTSYGMTNGKHLNCYGENGGKYLVENAFAYGGLKFTEGFFKDGAEQQLQHSVGKEKDHFALQMDHMADCVLNNKEPYTRGEEGLQDQVIMDAIYKSAKTKRPVKLKTYQGKDVFRGSRPRKL